MKLSNIAVIFIVIVLPLLLILAYYVSLQIDTINMQTAYNTKLLESTKEAIEAFEINTVEWNESASSVADSKRRDIFASINTFTTSLANNLGVAGTSKDYMLSRIPAIAYTLYDGYYIYSPTETKQTIKDDKGVVVCMSSKLANATYTEPGMSYVQKNVLTKTDGTDYVYNPRNNGRVLYIAKNAASVGLEGGVYYSKNEAGNYYPQYFTLDANNAAEEPGTSHILKPFMLYAEQIKNKSDEEVVINYTLDNYVTVYTKDETDNYIGKSGYLNKINRNGGSGENCITIDQKNFSSGAAYKYNKGSDIEINPIEGITFSGKEVKPEILSEVITYKETTGKMVTGLFYYVYEAEKDIKAYYDNIESKFFVLDNDSNRVYVESLTEPIYKKCMIPVDNSGKPSYVKLYRSLSSNDYYKWYTKATNGVYQLIDDAGGGALHSLWDDMVYEAIGTGSGYYQEEFGNILYDYSAINYCVETYYFTEWFNEQGFKYADGSTIYINDDNDPELNDSTFVTHKKEIIRNLVTQNLEQAITTYSKSGAGEFKLPELKESDWEQVVSNISIITFLQNIPIGMKYYNNYAIATSTTNKEFVNKNELYFYNRNTGTSTEPIYHAPYCEKYQPGAVDSDTNLVGYRSIDYIYKYYQEDDKPAYYIKHIRDKNGIAPDYSKTGSKIGESCYYCIVQRALQNEYKVVEPFRDAYYTTLARERYLQLESITIQQSKITIEKSVSPSVVDYGQTVTYEVRIRNEGEQPETINIVDYYNPNYDDTRIKQIDVNTGSVTYTRTKADGSKENNINATSITSGNDLMLDDDPTKYQFMHWGLVPIEAGEEILIQYTAKIESANIGEDIINTAVVRANNAEQTVLAKEDAKTQITKSITVEKASASQPIHVVLVLDSSGSVSISQAAEVRAAAKKLKQKLSEDFEGMVEFSFISFGTNANPIDDEDDYKAVQNGPTTNYINALSTTASELRAIGADKNKYVVFMSDGLPTLLSFNYNEVRTTLAKVFYKKEYSDLNPIQKGILDLTTIPALLLGGTIETVGGGWYGCIWESESVYKFSLLLTGPLAYPDLGLTKIAWNNIMKERNDVISEIGTDGKMFSVYFNTGFGGSPEYGLYRIASEHGPTQPADTYAKKASEGGLEEVYSQIADAIANEHRESIPLGKTVKVTLEDVSKITAIKMGSNNLDVDAIKAIIKARPDYDLGTDTGVLDLKDDTNIQPYFRYVGDIEIIY